MTMYFFYQKRDMSVWLPSLASERKNVMATKKPAFVSVLDLDNSFEGEADMTAEDVAGVKYTGPFYLDLDGDPEERQEVIDSAKQTIVTLKSKGVNVDSVKIFLSGKKGFHFEIPMEVFLPKISPHGIAGLPDIYREVARALDIPFSDPRIYTGRRGRMWRCPDVERDNGKYKVQVTASELMELTLERYDELCSAPRGTLAVVAPEYTPEFALVFTIAREKAERDLAKIKSRKSKSNPGMDLAKKFAGDWPETIEHICGNVILQDGVGWNRVSLQLAVTAVALGKKEEDLLDLAGPLINGHKGDGGRYNTPAKRRRDLRQMYRYASVNQALEFSVGGVMSLVKPECRANCDISLGEYVPEAETETVQVTNDDGEVVTSEVEVVDDENAPIRISKQGVFAKSEDGFKKITEIGFGNILLLKKMDGEHVGYEVEVFSKGKSCGTQLLSMDRFASRQTFQSWTMRWSSSMKGTDINASSVADAMLHRASSRKDMCYLVVREGLDFIKKPEVLSGEFPMESIWAVTNEVKSFSGLKYKLRGQINEQSTFNCDLMDAPELTLADKEMVEHALAVNQDAALAKIIGWFCAGFATQIVRYYFKKYPLLQVFGQAGAGKSETIHLFHHLHYWRTDPVERRAGGSTQLPVIAALESSSSLPVIFDEVKPREMRQSAIYDLRSIMRSNYDGHPTERGGISKDVAHKGLVVNRYMNVAPVAFVGEAFESQSALVDRCVIVNLSQDMRLGRTDHFNWFRGRQGELGKIGKSVAVDVLSRDPELIFRQIDDIDQDLFKRASDSNGVGNAEKASRPLFNHAVVVFGLDLFGAALRRAFGDLFDEKVAALRSSIVDNIGEILPQNMDEGSKVLNTLSYQTRVDNPDWKLVAGRDYTVSNDGRFVDIKLRNAFSLYVRYQRSHGHEVMYDSESAFVAAMYGHEACTKKICNDNPLLFDSPRALVSRFSAEKLLDLGVDSFKS